MHIEIELIDDGLAVLKVSGKLTRASSVHEFQARLENFQLDGRNGVLLDLSDVTHMNMAGLAALVELAARNSKVELGFCRLPEKNLEFLRKSGLDRGLRVFSSVADALSDKSFKSFSLTKTKAVLLCAGKGSRLAPLSDITPKPMLDIAGRPALHHIIDHLSECGLKDVLLNPGHLGNQIVDYFRHAPVAGSRIGFVNEGSWQHGLWLSNPIGSASTLKRMQLSTAAFANEIVVLCGDALVDIDLVEMMRQHRASGAAGTIAAKTVDIEQVHKYGIIETDPTSTVERFIEKPKPGVTQSRLANTGIYIFNADVLDLISNDNGLDIACDLLPAIMSSGQKLGVFTADFAWIDIGCGRDYVRALNHCVQERISFAKPMGEEIRPGVWAMPGSSVSRRAKISGRCHIGANARVEAGAHLEGVCTIGSGAVIQKGTHLVDTVVMPETCVRTGAWALDMILHNDWAVNHTVADGSAEARVQHISAASEASALSRPLKQVA